MSRLRRKLSYANVISTVCLFLVLGGGAWAASKVAFHSVGHKQLRPNAVDSRRVENGTLRRADLAPSVRPPGLGIDLPWYVGIRAQPIVVPPDSAKITSVDVPAGRYLVTVSAQLYSTEASDQQRHVDCGAYQQSIPQDAHSTEVLSFSDVEYSDGSIQLRCDSQSGDIQIANAQLYAVRIGSQ
jgi:hypothetical protein